MAFITKSGSQWVVRQGNSHKILSRHSNRADAEKRVAALHRENKPKITNRGKNASKRFKKR